ncbi:MAG: hypothetical protein H6Q02_760 [Acidobacteria bacterium]|nr:hypothetical protein [Acidobacteriota bacterium]
MRADVAVVPAHDLAEELLGRGQVAALERQLAEQLGELGVRPAPPKRRGEQVGGAPRLTGEQRQLGRLERPGGGLFGRRPVRAGPRDDLLAPRAQPLEQLLARQLGARRPLPRRDHVGLADDAPAVEQLDQRLDAGVEQCRAALELGDPLVEAGERAVQPLERVLAGRQPLEQVLVERLLLLLALALVLEQRLAQRVGVGAGDHEQPRVALAAQLAPVGVGGAAPLAEHRHRPPPPQGSGNRGQGTGATEPTPDPCPLSPSDPEPRNPPQRRREHRYRPSVGRGNRIGGPSQYL